MGNIGSEKEKDKDDYENVSLLKESLELIPRGMEMAAIQESNNLVVAFCLDGTVHALEGTSGTILWRTAGSFSEGPLLQKKFGKRPDISVEYLVEPLGDGAIFQVYSGAGREIKRLPFTLKSLVHMSPVHWRESEEKALYLIAKRESSIFVLDLMTGRLKKRQFKPKSKNELSDTEYGEDNIEIAPLERASLLVGRTDYHVQGFDEGNLEAQWEIILTQFKSLHGTTTEPGKDDFYTTFNGHLVSKKSVRPWIAKLGSPVLQIFRPVTAPKGFITLQEIPLKGSANNAVAAKRHVLFDQTRATFYFDDLVNVGTLNDVTNSSRLIFALPQSHYPVIHKENGENRPLFLRDQDTRHQFLSVQRVSRQSIPPSVKLLGFEGSGGRSRYWDYQISGTVMTLLITFIIVLLFKFRGSRKQNKSHSAALQVSEEVLGYGSHGTVVLRGTFDGRPVAVKRLLAEFYSLADHEISLLQTHDTHPNVIRYFYREQQERFILVALELASCSLHEFIGGNDPSRSSESLSVSSEFTLPPPKSLLISSHDVDRIELLRQVMAGIEFLHAKGLIHRDLKPQNILLQFQESPLRECPRVLISDFGLSRKLVEMESSFHATAKAAGTLGWRAPEIIFNEESVKFTFNTTSFPNNNNNKEEDSTTGPMKIGKSVDIFAAGLIFFFVLSGGGHAFGSRLVRESNISTGKMELNSKSLSVEADNLIRSMLSRKAKDRPSASQVLSHPFFWSSERRLEFVCSVSDILEAEEQFVKREQAEAGKGSAAPPGFEPIIIPVLPLRDLIDSVGTKVFTGTWHKALDRKVFQDLTNHRYYMVNKLHDLLRAIRNKRNHFHETPIEIQEIIGRNPVEFWNYFEMKFPKLLMETFSKMKGIKELEKF